MELTIYPHSEDVVLGQLHPFSMTVSGLDHARRSAEAWGLDAGFVCARAAIVNNGVPSWPIITGREYYKQDPSVDWSAYCMVADMVLSPLYHKLRELSIGCDPIYGPLLVVAKCVWQDSGILHTKYTPGIRHWVNLVEFTSYQVHLGRNPVGGCSLPQIFTSIVTPAFRQNYVDITLCPVVYEMDKDVIKKGAMNISIYDPNENGTYKCDSALVAIDILSSIWNNWMHPKNKVSI